MSDDQQPQTPDPQNPAPENTGTSTDRPKGPTVNFPELLDLCGGILDRIFFKLPLDQSKQLFKELKKGQQSELGDINLGEVIKLRLKLAMDYSEFVGPGFNFEVFRVALKNLLSRIATTLKVKADLNLRTSQQGGILVGFAGLTVVGEQHNALMMMVELGKPGEVIIRLVFVDPAQFEETA